MINYFNFRKYKDKYLLTNDFGDFVFLSKQELKKLLSNSVEIDSNLYKELIEKHFIITNNKIKLTQTTQGSYRNAKSYLFSSTSLHIFVVTNACNMRCIYCQARDNEHHHDGVMNEEIAKKSVDIALQSPEKNLNFEFQGGEPLLNFKIIKYIYDYSQRHKGNHVINYSIVSNLTLLDDEIVDFIVKNNINISTSLDGNEWLHNINRPFIDKLGTFQQVKSGIKKLKQEYKNIGAIQTTTKYSLNLYKEIINQYLQMGFDNIFLRPLTPLGTAKDSWKIIGYTVNEFLDFYKKSIDYIIQLNKQGVVFREGHASIFLSRILRKQAQNYMELRSPCGASVGQIAYYHNGDIYTCDEGRMLSEMGDDAFKLGNVHTSSYDELISSKTCKTVCISSVLESLPGCCDCVYQPYCGTCPVVNYAIDHSLFKQDFNDYKCGIYKGMLDIIFDYLYKGDTETIDILKTW